MSGSWMEDEARVGGVVVGDQDDGPLGLRRAELADDVVGGAAGEEAPQVALAGRVVGGHPGGRGGGERGAADALSPQGGDAADRPQPRADPERPPVGPMGGLGLDPRLGAELGEAGDQPLGGAPLALRGRGSLDPLQLLELRAQAGLVGLHRGSTLPGTYH